MKREVRTFSGAQLRAKTADTKPGASGYAAVFNQVADIGWFREVIKPGAFTRAIAEKQDVRCLMNHDANMILGRTKASTLTLSEDGKGLKFDCDFPPTQVASDLGASLERGDIDQCSFAFLVVKQTWTDQKMDDGTVVQTRTIEDVDLLDVSIVTYPAYTGTSAEGRTKALFPDGLPEEVRSRKEKRDGQCECDCAECEDGDCDDCLNPDCEDENCRCKARSAKAGEKKTKNVRGVALIAADFAHVGDVEYPNTWTLPINDASQVRKSLSRFSQIKGLTAEERAAAWSKIVAAAKRSTIQISEENSLKLFHTSSYRDAKAVVRSFDPDGDGDDDEPLIDAIIDARDGCGTVASTAYNALYLIFDGDPEFTNPVLEAFVKQSKVLIDRIQTAVGECQKEVAEPTSGDRSAKPALSMIDRVNRMAELEKD